MRSCHGGSNTLVKDAEDCRPRYVGLRALGLTEGLWVRLGLGLSGTGWPPTTRSVLWPSDVTANRVLCGLAGCIHFLGLSDSLKGSAGQAAHIRAILALFVHGCLMQH